MIINLTRYLTFFRLNILNIVFFSIHNTKHLKNIWKHLKCFYKVFAFAFKCFARKSICIYICIWKIWKHLHLHLNALESIWPQVWLPTYQWLLDINRSLATDVSHLALNYFVGPVLPSTLPCSINFW